MRDTRIVVTGGHAEPVIAQPREPRRGVGVPSGPGPANFEQIFSAR